MSFAALALISLLSTGAAPEGDGALAKDIRSQLEGAGFKASDALLVIDNEHRSNDAVVSLATSLAAELGVLTERELETLAGESQLVEGLGGDALREAGAAMGAKLLLSVMGAGSANGSLWVKGIAIATGEVLFSVKGAEANTIGGPVAPGSLVPRMRRLADDVARAVDALPGEARYQRFAVMRFDESGQLAKDNELGLLVAAELTSTLRGDHGLLLVEREQLNRVIEELALGQTGIIDESQSVEVGKVLGVDALILGSVSDAGAQYRVNAKVVSVSTGEVAATAQASLPAADLVALSSEAVVLRTRTGALYRSTLLPGWGQLYNRQPGKAALFVGAEGASIGLAAAFHLLSNQTQSTYDGLGPEAPQERFDNLRRKIHDQRRFRNAFIYAAIGIHALNLIDAFLSGQTYESATVSGPGAGVVFSF